MKLEIKKMDGRNTGHPYFKYCVSILRGSYAQSINRESYNLFFECREWCWQTWGASKEVDDWVTDQNFNTHQIVLNRSTIHIVCHNEHWCWKHDKDAKNRIYLAKDEDLMLFKLRWE
jgi:hypothetical protein